MSLGRKILKLGTKPSSPAGGDEEVLVQVGMFDLLLPSRRFNVKHKVAVLGDVSLTTEFLLRLLHAVDGINERDAAVFFGFNEGEMAFVVNEAESRAFISRESGRLWLTDAGHDLFQGGDRPQIFEVEKRSERIGFDLLSLSPVDWAYLGGFEGLLPELAVRDAELAANASRKVPESFRRFYGEISAKRDKDVAETAKRSLYSVDDVIPGDRFSAVVPVVAVSSMRRPSDPEPSFDAWRPSDEVAKRDAVVHGVAAFLDNLKVVSRPEDSIAQQVLLDIAGEFLKEFTTRSGLSDQRYFKEVASRAGEFRSDRPTVGVIGPLFLPDNRKRLSAALNLAGPRSTGDDGRLVWTIPTQGTWGASRALETLLESVKGEAVSQLEGTPPQLREAYVIACGKPPRYLAKAFDKVLIRPDNGALPGSLEIMLIPQRIVAVTIHAALGDGRGFPVPLGVMSYDSKVVRRAHQYLESQLPSQLVAHGTSSQFDLKQILDWPVPSEATPPHVPD